MAHGPEQAAIDVRDISAFGPPAGAATSVPARRWHPALWLAGAVLFVVAAAVLDVPDGSAAVTLPGGARLPGLCLLRGWLGVDCPGCGLTRSLVAMAQADLGRAWRYHPIGPLFFAATVGQIPYRTVQWIGLRRGRDWAIPRWATHAFWLALVAACLLQWLVRLVSGPWSVVRG